MVRGTDVPISTPIVNRTSRWYAFLKLLARRPDACRQKSGSRHPDIAWPEIIGLRNRLIHGYDSVDFDILWQIVTDDLAPLIAALEKALETY
jgi:uncharacterized protein with HEPN domain